MKNGVEASVNGGKVTLTAAQLDPGMVRLTVIDEGEGIPSERIPKLGEPFFTTKESGTGLGLMISYKIIENHHGIMQLTSEHGKGTRIDIYLPTEQQKLLQKEQQNSHKKFG